MISHEVPVLVLKITLLGHGEVGKSSIMRSYTNEPIQDTYQPTIGLEFKIKEIELDGKQVKLQIWDSAGQERFRSITSTYLKNASGIIFVYDLTNPESLEAIENQWLKEVEAYCDKDTQLLLVGNKKDLDGQKVEDGRIQELSSKLKMPSILVSAKTGENINQAFMDIVGRILKNHKAEP